MRNCMAVTEKPAKFCVLSSNSEKGEHETDSVIKSLLVSSRCISNVYEADFVEGSKDVITWFGHGPFHYTYR